MIDWEALDAQKFADENQMAAGLVELTRLSPIEQKQINAKAVSLVVWKASSNSLACPIKRGWR